MTIDPREAIRKLPDYLSQVYGVTFKFGAVVTDIAYPVAIAAGEK